MRTANRFSVKAAQKLQFSTRTDLRFSLRTNFMEQPSGKFNPKKSCRTNGHVCALLTVAKRNGQLLFRTKTNIRGSVTAEYSCSYEYSSFGRIFGKPPNIRPFYRIFGKYGLFSAIYKSFFNKIQVKLCLIFGKMAEYSAFFRIFGQNTNILLKTKMANFPN